MSLYDNFDVKETDPDVSGWSSKPASVETNANAPLNFQPRKSGGRFPPRNAGGPVRFNHLTGKIETEKAVEEVRPFAEPPNQMSTFFAGPDEYNPLRPSDYLKVRKMRHLQSKASWPEWMKEEESPGPSSDSDSEEEIKASKKSSSIGAAIAPPTSLIQQDEAPKEMPAPVPMEADTFAAPLAPPSMKQPSGGPPKDNVIGRMMAKMGYKHGSGLGKSEQGISSALVVAKTSLRGGKIINADDIVGVPPPVAAPLPVGSVPRDVSAVQSADLKNPTKVVVLRNMVGPGEVDDDLEGETIEECSKYGKVSKCVIYEIPGVIVEEAVRIFVEFETNQQAIKAVVDLHGRFFGGKVVKANFYSMDKFRNYNLGDPIA